MAAHFTRTLPSRLDLLSVLADEIGAFLDAHVADEDLAYRALLVTTEAVTNAMEHGNAANPALSVALAIAATPEHVSITVEDEGPGFAPADAPDAIAEGDVLADGHRGLFLMRAYTQLLRFENGGRRVVLGLDRGA